MPYVQGSSHRLKVLFVLPPFLPTPPEGYGGVEAVAAALLPALKAAGVETIVCTPNGSTVEATELHELTKPLYPVIYHNYIEVAPQVENYIAKVMKLAWREDIDLIHDFSGRVVILNSLAASLPSGSYPPVIHTMHEPIRRYQATYRELLRHPNLAFTAISNNQIAQASGELQERTSVIYNGVNLADYPLGKGGGRLLVLGRFCSDKGQDRLIEYCVKNGIGLDVAGTVAEMSTMEEIEAELAKGADSDKTQHPALKLFRRILPLIDGEQIKFYGNVSGKLKTDLLGGASALVVPNRWAEPFGMVAIEAMASGTPVIAMNSGSMPELIIHGTTGYLAETFEELCDYLTLKHITKLDRAACRKHIVAEFSTEVMAQRYLDVYQQILGAHAPIDASKPSLGLKKHDLSEISE